MSSQTYFQVQRGSVVSDCMPETYNFINQNLEYFHKALRPAIEALSDQGEITFISLESQWSFGCHIEKAELGRVASGKGVVSEGTVCTYDEILERLA